MNPHSDSLSTCQMAGARDTGLRCAHFFLIVLLIPSIALDMNEFLTSVASRQSVPDISFYRDQCSHHQHDRQDPKLATLFSNCFPKTLDTTVVRASFNDSFVITGDIDAMWLRDSTNQVLPYVPYVAQDPPLTMLFTGLVRRQLRSVLIDSYANAYNEVPNGNGH